MTPVTAVALDLPLPLELADEVRRRMLFVSSEILGFDLVVEDERVVGVNVSTVDRVDAEELSRKVNLLVDGDVRPQLPVPARVVWTSSQSRPGTREVFDELLRAGVAVRVGEGQVAIGGPLLALFRYFDRILVDLLTSRFTTEEYQYPTLIRTATLEAAGYVTSFPQNLFFVTRLHNDIDVYHEVQDRYGTTAIDEQLLRSCRSVDYCLPPTMCYHTFGQYRGRTVGEQGMRVVTALGKAFRYEAGYAATLERLWDFTIREMVFMGTRAEVLEARETVMAAVFELMDRLGLSGRCEVGSDPFFGGLDTPDRIWSQRMMELKYELRLSTGGDRTIAVGSFNFHNDLFGKDFGISHSGGGPVSSGCVGFGLERLVYAFVCQFGLDVEQWPSEVTDRITEGRVRQ